MTPASIIVQQPEGAISQLVLLMHGVGSVPQSMLGIARWFASRDSSAMVVSVASPQPSHVPGGLQWFSVMGITEDNRQARVDAAMPAFVATVQHWQQTAGVDHQHTTLVGFSQGAIMALESTKLAEPPAMLCVAFAGRFATLPTGRTGVTIHLLHGDSDPVMPMSVAQAAQSCLLASGSDVSLDVAAGVGHEPHPALLRALAARLT